MLIATSFISFNSTHCLRGYGLLRLRDPFRAESAGNNCALPDEFGFLERRGKTHEHGSRLLVVLVLVAAGLALTSAVSAAPASTSFTIVGYEYAFTSTVGSFAGSGTGNAGDKAAWNATVDHDPLGSTPTYITGGSVAMTTASASGHLDYVTGALAYHGGTITTLNPGPNCTNQQYLVTGALQDVATSSTSGGSGTFTVTLTHYRYTLFGHCLIYKAGVTGIVSFTYT